MGSDEKGQVRMGALAVCLSGEERDESRASDFVKLSKEIIKFINSLFTTTAQLRLESDANAILRD
jgi:hypothetical protein